VEDFLFQCCVDLATDTGLPVKLHLGYPTGASALRFARVCDHVREVVPVVQANPSATAG
jgi:hypothetical protein